jgi:hypothetical protein
MSVDRSKLVNFNKIKAKAKTHKNTLAKSHSRSKHSSLFFRRFSDKKARKFVTLISTRGGSTSSTGRPARRRRSPSASSSWKIEIFTILPWCHPELGLYYKTFYGRNLQIFVTS